MQGWSLFPIWGLELAENGHGLDRPIFGDATLVTRSFVKKYASDERAKAMFSGEGLREFLETGGASQVGTAPLDHVVDIPPGGFIAVRRADGKVAERYAQSICALLTASSVLTSGRGVGFAMTPLALHWAMIPSWVRLNPEGELQADYKPVLNSFIHLTPISVTHKQLADSWERDTPISGTWRVHKHHDLSKALSGDWGSLSGLRKHIRDASITLTKAMSTSDPALSLVLGSVALEQVLEGHSGFKEVEELVTSVFDGPSGAAELTQLLKNRHDFVHEAKSPQNPEEHIQQVLACWAILNLAAIVASQGLNSTEFLAHLRGRVEAKKLAARFRLQGNPALAEKVERESTKAVAAPSESRK